MHQFRTVSIDQPSSSYTFPLSISVLNRIFDFAADDASDAVLRLGMVNQQWKDTLQYAPSMWKRLMIERWRYNRTAEWKANRSQSSTSDSDEDKQLPVLKPPPDAPENFDPAS